MWRGGLSAPSSLYVHAGRPLISENGTSSLLHEVMHVALRIRAAQGYDWIVEGLAEYYGLELLRRSGTLTRVRAERAEKFQRDWAGSSEQLCGATSTGATTALAVTIFMDLHREIRQASDKRFGFDDVVAKLVTRDAAIDLADLEATVEELIGTKPETLHIDKLPGCRNIGGADEQP